MNDNIQYILNDTIRDTINDNIQYIFNDTIHDTMNDDNQYAIQDTIQYTSCTAIHNTFAVAIQYILLMIPSDTRVITNIHDAIHDAN